MYRTLWGQDQNKLLLWNSLLPIISPHHPVCVWRWRAQRNDIKGKWNCSKRWNKRYALSSTNERSWSITISFILGHRARESWGALRALVLLILQPFSFLSAFQSFSLSIPFPPPPALSLPLSSSENSLLFKWQKQTCLRKNNKTSLFFQFIVLLVLWKLLYDPRTTEYHWVASGL